MEIKSGNEPLLVGLDNDIRESHILPSYWPLTESEWTQNVVTGDGVMDHEGRGVRRPQVPKPMFQNSALRQ